jgi:hypothetical protein
MLKKQILEFDNSIAIICEDARVVYITLDTTRSDKIWLEFYGYQRSQYDPIIAKVDCEKVYHKFGSMYSIACVLNWLLSDFMEEHLRDWITVNLNNVDYSNGIARYSGKKIENSKKRKKKAILENTAGEPQIFTINTDDITPRRITNVIEQRIFLFPRNAIQRSCSELKTNENRSFLHESMCDYCSFENIFLSCNTYESVEHECYKYYKYGEFTLFVFKFPNVKDYCIKYGIAGRVHDTDPPILPHLQDTLDMAYRCRYDWPDFDMELIKPKRDVNESDDHLAERVLILNNMLAKVAVVYNKIIRSDNETKLEKIAYLSFNVFPKLVDLTRYMVIYNGLWREHIEILPPKIVRFILHYIGRPYQWI